MTGHVYLIREEDDGPFKIGWCRKFPPDRVRDLQIGNPRELHLRGAYAGTLKDEAKLHRLLSDHRIRGEWFEPVEIIERIAGGDVEGLYALSDLDKNLLHLPTYQEGKQINREAWAHTQAERGRKRRSEP